MSTRYNEVNILMKGTEFKTQLLRRYVNDQATKEELEVLHYLIEQGEVSNELPLVMAEVWENSILEERKSEKRTRQLKITKWRWISAAAVFIMIGLYITVPYFSDTKKVSPNTTLAKTAPVLPGKNNAILTFSNGKAIQLSSGHSGIVVGGQVLRYNDSSPVGPGMNQSGSTEASIRTPRGGTYQVTLPDGSKVQLNAASSITFNTDFDGLPERTVNLSGEAYFEVAKRKSKPFIVNTTNQRVTVLGTHFNISAYEDDQYSFTTLVEGSVKINGKMLKPNEQAQQSDGNITIRTVDVADAVDWKNGEFIARNESLESLMKKVSRWYDVDIAYENTKLKEKTFSGSLSRYSRAEDLLNALKFYGINSRLSNRKIYITH